MNKVACIIIFYNPTAEDIAYATSMSEHWEGVIVDNSSSPSLSTERIGRLAYICNGANLGIAEAQNIGIRHVLSHSASTHIVFFDQDSRVEADYPQRMTKELETVRSSVGNLVLLGPTVVRKDDGQEYRSAVHHYDYDRQGFSRRRHIISSGSCLLTEALDTVGLMESRLFIDYVDFEWCWRAIKNGYAVGITSNVTLAHKVGQKELSIGRHKVIVSAPVRYFYQYRNFLWLLRRKYVPLQWKSATGVKFCLRLFYLPFCVDKGFECWKNMLRGIKAGLIG